VLEAYLLFHAGLIEQDRRLVVNDERFAVHTRQYNTQTMDMLQIDSCFY
jgi:hypothetical protein